MAFGREELLTGSIFTSIIEPSPFQTEFFLASSYDIEIRLAFFIV